MNAIPAAETYRIELVSDTDVQCVLNLYECEAKYSPSGGGYDLHVVYSQAHQRQVVDAHVVSLDGSRPSVSLDVIGGRLNIAWSEPFKFVPATCDAPLEKWPFYSIAGSQPEYFIGLTEAQACEHERRNDHGDACLDCGAVQIEGRWQ